MKHRSKAHLSKQLATKRDVQRARDDILSAIIHADRGGHVIPEAVMPAIDAWVRRPTLREEFAVPSERIERAVNG